MLSVALSSFKHRDDNDDDDVVDFDDDDDEVEEKEEEEKKDDDELHKNISVGINTLIVIIFILMLVCSIVQNACNLHVLRIFPSCTRCCVNHGQ